MEFRFVNTEGREEMAFKPIKKGEVGIYCCGPTVYNYAHIGNLRPYTIQDVLVRALTYSGFKVNHIVNITDVGHLTSDADDGDDKMIKAAKEKGMSVWDIADFFTKAFIDDIDRLNINHPSKFTKATEHIQDMIDMISTLEEKGFTYQAGGNVYFDTGKFPDYGKMAQLDLDALQHGARVDVDENKKNPSDFVLWFTKSKFGKQAMTWESPWGEGYPGWHIECSAMSSKYLGKNFDIHCGGVDHIPVHHTNEIAQSEAANGCKWVNYWLHNEFIIMKDGKMSKSKGGFLTLQALVDEGFDPLDYRYMLLGAHYRSQLMFTWDSLKAAQSARKSLMKKFTALGSDTATKDQLSNISINWIEQFEGHLSQDLNTPRVLADVWGILKDKEISNAEKLFLIKLIDGVLGLDIENRSKNDSTVNEQMDEEIGKLIEDRNNARKNRDFARADEIRDKLLEQGIRLIDTPQGTGWERI